jgi:hypothetical protein
MHFNSTIFLQKNGFFRTHHECEAWVGPEKGQSQVLLPSEEVLTRKEARATSFSYLKKL